MRCCGSGGCGGSCLANSLTGRRRGMEIVTARSLSRDQGRRRKASNGYVVAQLLDSPLPTPRRSCCGSALDTPRSLERGSAGGSPQRTHVPFSWERSPGVPKDASGGGKEQEVLPPKPPPGRGGSGTPCHPHARAYHGNTTDATSSDDDENDTFSDALDRISSSDRLAAFSARLSSIEGAGSRRSPSFIMDRFLPAANAIATTSADKHPKKSPRRSARCSKHDEEAPAAARRETHSPRRASVREQPKQFPRHIPALQHEERVTPPRQSKEAAQTQRINADEQGDQVSPRACGLTVFFPWSIKPVLCGFPRTPARCWTPRADVGTTTPSPPHRSTTLGDVVVKEGKLCEGDLSHWYEERSGSGKEWSSPGWGMAILGTSKRYCADARKALSRLARSATDGSGSRRSGKPAVSPLRSTSGKMPQLKPPSESWLSRAREQCCE